LKLEIEMKLYPRILLLSAVMACAFPAYAADLEISNEGNNTVVLASIEADAGHTGKPVDLWISAVYKGVAYFYNGSSWVRYAGGPLPSASKGLKLGALNKLTVAKGADLTSLPGADLYVGYGTSEDDMKNSSGKLKKVGKLGKKFRWPAPRAQ
jgi:hypothetical protein